MDYFKFTILVEYLNLLSVKLSNKTIDRLRKILGLNNFFPVFEVEIIHIRVLCTIPTILNKIVSENVQPTLIRKISKYIFNEHFYTWTVFPSL